MSTRGAQLAAEFLQRFTTIEELLGSLTDEQWTLLDRVAYTFAT